MLLLLKAEHEPEQEQEQEPGQKQEHEQPTKLVVGDVGGTCVLFFYSPIVEKKKRDFSL